MVAFDAADANARLDALVAKVEECRAAVARRARRATRPRSSRCARTVDAMAEDLAVLRAAVGGAELA